MVQVLYENICVIFLHIMESLKYRFYCYHDQWCMAIFGYIAKYFVSLMEVTNNLKRLEYILVLNLDY